MITQRLVRPTTARLSTASSWRAYSQSAAVVSPLAYDLHEPAKPKFDERHSPILFLHGLFGSKKNNRGISKYVCLQKIPGEL